MYRICWFCPMLLFCAIFTPDPDERVRKKMAQNFALRLEIQKLRDKLLAHGIMDSEGRKLTGYVKAAIEGMVITL